MNRDEWLQDNLANLERRWGAGHYPAMIEALLLCGHNGAALPEWLTASAVSELCDYYSRGLAAQSRGRHGNARARDEMTAVHRMRWSIARVTLTTPGRSRRDAFAEAAAMLTGHNSRAGAASWEQVRDSYDLVEEAISNGEGWRYLEE